MRTISLLLIPFLLAGCGVSKATHTKALESVQRLTAERDAVNERIKSLSDDLEKAKKENAALSAAKGETQEKLKKTADDLKRCSDELTLLKGRAAKADKLEEELNLLKVKLQEIRTQTETLLGEITEASR